MDKGAIKKFAVTAREKLLQAVAQKAFELGIEEDVIKDAKVYEDGFLINEKFYKKYEITQREKLIREVEQKGYEQVIEEVAYTWFNRFIAIRFMEVNDYLPTGVRVFSSIEKGKKDPDALTEVLMLVDELDLDQEKVYELQDANDDEDLFKYILIKQCNKLGEMMPEVFEEIEDVTELLLPDNLVLEKGIINDMVTFISEDEWVDVEIIGWLYQYYNSDLKEQVGGLRNNSVSKEHLPVVTQLFTPKWIVQYMVENSLGKLYDKLEPNNSLAENWEYYLKRDNLDQKKLVATGNLEDLKIIDPASGSGHILIYVFDLLYDMYREAGYNRRDISQLILKNNIFGLDIDKRSSQIAIIALWMKALEKDSSLLQNGKKLKFNVIEVIDADVTLSEEAINYFVNMPEEKEDIKNLQNAFKNGKQFGSLITPPELNYKELLQRIDKYDELITDLYDESLILELAEKLKPILLAGLYLNQKYDVVITNPPYHNKYNSTLRKFMREKYKFTHRDLFSAFIERSIGMTKQNGYSALMTPFTWMFISSHEKLRDYILEQATISSLVQLEYSAFEEATVPICTFVIQNQREDTIGDYIRLADFKGADLQPIKLKEAANNSSVSYRYEANSDSFSDIPATPIAYWASEQMRSLFLEEKIGDSLEVKRGMTTSNNAKFLRLWYEIDTLKFNGNSRSREEAKQSKSKWFPYSKGGGFRKWYGFYEYVINWENDGEDVIAFAKTINKSYTRTIVNLSYYFKPSTGFAYITSGPFSSRIIPEGFLYDSGGPGVFGPEEKRLFILGLLNSKIAQTLLRILNPTINLQIADVVRVPLPHNFNSKIMSLPRQVIDNNIAISKSDWDSFETSWDFKTHPFIEFKQDATTLEGAFENWEREANDRFQTLKSNEEELNRIFIDLYGLQDELTAEVEDSEVTVSRANQERDVKSFISYAVGLMFGRYSLDEEGLAFAGGTFKQDNYKIVTPDADNVIPIVDDVYFEDDVVTKFVEILKLVFGEERLEDNLAFIADTLTRQGNETSRQRIRRYFLRDFYKDHVQMYKKHPIYWMFDSGRQNGFKALVYLHRYESDLVSRVRTGYLHEQQGKYRDEMDRLDLMMESDIPKREITRATKQKEKLQKQLLECQQYDQVIAHLAHQQIDLDLDDGVKVNYAKFQNVKIPQGEGRKPIKANGLAKI